MRCLAPFAVSLGLSALCLCAAVALAAEKAGPLRVGLEDSYPPFSFVDEAGKRSGFDHDLAVALCASMGATCEYAFLPMEDLLAGLRAGKLDFVVDGLAATDERKTYMDFSDTYYRSRTIFIGDPSVSITPEGLKGKKLGAQSGTSQEAYIRQHWAGIAEITTASYDGILAMLIKGELAAILVDGLPGYDFLKTEQGELFDALGDPLLPDDIMSQAHIGVRKNAKELLAEINKALIAIRMSEEYDRINRKYFPFSIY